MAQIKADEITKLIREQIDNYETKIAVDEVGSVMAIGDGIARVYGLDKVMAGELLSFPHDVAGIAMNLEEDQVGVVLLGGATIITADSEGKFCRWDAKTGRLLSQSECESVRSLTVAGKDVFGLDWNGKLKNLRDRATQVSEKFVQDSFTVAMAGSHDGKRIALSGDLDKTVILIDCLTGREMKRFPAPDWPGQLAFSSDDKILYGLNTQVERWELVNDRHETRPGPIRSMMALALSLDGRYAAFGGNDTQITVMEVETGQLVARFQNLPQRMQGGQVEIVAFSPNNRMMAWCSFKNRLVRIGELASGREIATFQGSDNSPLAVVTALAFSPDGSFVVAGFDDGTALIWDIPQKTRHDPVR